MSDPAAVSFRLFARRLSGNHWRRRGISTQLSNQSNKISRESPVLGANVNGPALEGMRTRTRFRVYRFISTSVAQSSTCTRLSYPTLHNRLRRIMPSLYLHAHFSRSRERLVRALFTRPYRTMFRHNPNSFPSGATQLLVKCLLHPPPLKITLSSK